MDEFSICTTISDVAVDRAAAHVAAILKHALEYEDSQRATVVWDGQCNLALALTEAYRRGLPRATFIDFDSTPPDEVLAAFEELGAGDLVVLIQSTNFRLNAFRIRVGLFKRGLKVIEHPHLSRMRGAECEVYIDALAYDPAYYRGVGLALKRRIDAAQVGVIESGEQLIFPVGFETAKVNIGDYSTLRNVGGQYPIGEIFTESTDLEAVHGRVRIFAFGDTSYTVNKPTTPITLVIEKGRVVEAIDSTPEFEVVLENIRADEGQVWVRELGFGMNRAFSVDRMVTDIGTYERMCGVHLSLGAKHASYNKPNIRKKGARHHVDVFAITNAVRLDDELIYRDGAWIVEPDPGT